MAMAVTQIATAAAALAWMFIEWIVHKKPSMLGIISGAVAGLVAITPASGFVGASGALWIGAAAGLGCFFMSTTVKRALGYDDLLDVFGIHAVGGIIGAILTGVFAVEAIGGVPGLLEGNAGQVATQLYGIAATIIWCAVASFVILVDRQHSCRRESESSGRGRRPRHQPAWRGGPVETSTELNPRDIRA